MTSPTHNITAQLHELQTGSAESQDRLFALVYKELHSLASHMRARTDSTPYTLSTTALVNECYFHVIGTSSNNYQNRAHLMGVAATAMRRILVQSAREKHSLRSDGRQVAMVDEEKFVDKEKRNPELLALDDALKEFEQRYPDAAQVVELRFFGGLTNEEVAEVQGCSVARVRRDWEFARTWLYN